MTGYGSTCNITVSYVRAAMHAYSRQYKHDHLNIGIAGQLKIMGKKVDFGPFRQGINWGYNHSQNSGFNAHIVDRYFKCRGGNVKLLDNKPPPVAVPRNT